MAKKSDILVAVGLLIAAVAIYFITKKTSSTTSTSPTTTSSSPTTSSSSPTTTTSSPTTTSSSPTTTSSSPTVNYYVVNIVNNDTCLGYINFVNASGQQSQAIVTPGSNVQLQVAPNSQLQILNDAQQVVSTYTINKNMTITITQNLCGTSSPPSGSSFSAQPITVQLYNGAICNITFGYNDYNNNCNISKVTVGVNSTVDISVCADTYVFLYGPNGCIINQYYITQPRTISVYNYQCSSGGGSSPPPTTSSSSPTTTSSSPTTTSSSPTSTSSSSPTTSCPPQIQLCSNQVCTPPPQAAYPTWIPIYFVGQNYNGFTYKFYDGNSNSQQINCNGVTYVSLPCCSSYFLNATTTIMIYLNGQEIAQICDAIPMPVNINNPSNTDYYAVWTIFVNDTGLVGGQTSVLVPAGGQEILAAGLFTNQIGCPLLHATGRLNYIMFYKSYNKTTIGSTGGQSVVNPDYALVIWDYMFFTQYYLNNKIPTLTLPGYGTHSITITNNTNNYIGFLGSRNYANYIWIAPGQSYTIPNVVDFEWMIFLYGCTSANDGSCAGSTGYYIYYNGRVTHAWQGVNPLPSGVTITVE